MHFGVPPTTKLIVFLSFALLSYYVVFPPRWVLPEIYTYLHVIYVDLERVCVVCICTTVVAAGIMNKS